MLAPAPTLMYGIDEGLGSGGVAGWKAQGATD
jgi:hypothetical protein